MHRDEIFYPVRVKQYNHGGKDFLPWFGFGASWFIYLFYGYAPRKECHVNPWSPLFARKAAHCAASLGLIAAWAAFALLPYARAFGWAALATHYLMPMEDVAAGFVDVLDLPEVFIYQYVAFLMVP